MRLNEGEKRMSDNLDAIVGGFLDLPDCADPFEEMGKRVLDARARFAHLDCVLRECETADDAIYRTAAALWEAIAGPANSPTSATPPKGKP
jgi:hypothetical protein